MQKAESDYSDRTAEQLSSPKGNIDNQIERLFTDYKRSKEAYQTVIQMYSSVLSPINEDAIENEIEKDMLEEINEDIQNKASIFTIKEETTTNVTVSDHQVSLPRFASSTEILVTPAN